MKLTFQAKLKGNDKLFVELNGEKKWINEFDQSVSFNTNDYVNQVYIGKEKDKSDITLLHILFFAVFAPLIGLINIFFQNTDSEWKKNIRPYSFKTAIPIEMGEDKVFNILYKHSYFSPERNKYIPPQLIVNNEETENIKITKNIESFGNSWFDYITNFLSTLSILFIILGIILHGLITRNYSIYTIILVSSLLAAFVLLAIIVCFMQYKVMLKMKKEFENNSTDRK